MTVASLDREAYAVSVKEELEKRAERKTNISAIHSSLYRLEDKGFLSSEFGGATNKRGGKSKRYFRVTNAGYDVLKQAKDLREGYWKTIPRLAFFRL